MRTKRIEQFLWRFLIPLSAISNWMPNLVMPDLEVVEQRISSTNFGEDLLNCVDPNRTTVYLRTEGAKIVAVNSQQTFEGLTLQQCAQKCIKEDGECRSFEYDSERLLCTLMAEDSQPFGRGVLTIAKQGNAIKQLLNPNIAHFQRICLPIGDGASLCPSAHAFERFPQHVLIGHALEIHSVKGLSECLAICLEAKQQLRMDCHSAMYFYESGTCMLNRERRSSVDGTMFREESGTELVDYFESVCADVRCAGSAEMHWIRTEYFQIDPRREAVLGDELNFDECRQKCMENKLYGTAFPCKAFVHSTSNGQCQLSAESGVRDTASKDQRTKRRKQWDIKRANGIGGSGESAEQQQPLDELSSFSTGQYHEKVCLPSTDDQTVRGNCSQSATFELFPGKALNVSLNQENGSKTRVLSTSTLADCLRTCLIGANINCRSVQFRRDRDECVISELSQLSNPELFHSAHFVDYYDNLCFRPNSDNDHLVIKAKISGKLADLTPEKRKRERPVMEEEMEEGKSGGNWGNGTEHEQILMIEEFSGANEKVEEEESERKPVIATECRLRGIQIRAKLPVPSSGTLFLHDYSANCSAHFRNALMAVLLLPYPETANATNNCPGRQLGPHLWSFVVVLQQKSGGENDAIDPPLLTGQERVFNVTCDFNNIHQQQSAASQADSATSLTTTKIPEINTSDNSSTSLALPKLHLRMALLRNGHPISVVKLGEELEIRWTFGEAAQNARFGMFVDSCLAERIDGNPPDPPPMALIVDGCPEKRVYAAHLISAPTPHFADGLNATLRVFRFDGSRRVRIRCAVNVCMAKCPSANCTRTISDDDEGINSDDQSAISFGRRKRNNDEGGGGGSMGLTTLGELADLVERYDRMRSEATQPTERGAKSSQQQMGQQSTTISGSYTIMDNDEKQNGDHDPNEGNGRNAISTHGLKRVKLIRGKKGHIDEVENEEDGRPNADDRIRADDDLINLMGGGQKAMKKHRDNDERQKKPTTADGSSIYGKDSSSSSNNSFCIARLAAILAIISLVTMAIVQCFLLFRFLRKKYAAKKMHSIQKENEAQTEAPQAEEQPNQMAPISAPISLLDLSSVEYSGFRGIDGGLSWHKTSALCAQEQCRHCHWDLVEGERSPSQLYFHHRRRPSSLISWADEEDEIVERPQIHTQRQTVFPAEPFSRRRSIVESV